MSLRIQRLGFVGIGLQTGFQVPAAIADYVYFTNNTLHGVVDNLPIEPATSLREKTYSSIGGLQHSEGDFEMLVDSKMAGYFLVAAMGSVSAASQGGSVFTHTITRNNTNTPQFLTLTNDRSVDRQNYYDVAVDQLDLEVGTDLATLKAKLVGNFPQTTASGTATTASGNVMSFKNAAFAFGSTVAAARTATNLAPHDFKLTIKNSMEVVPRHGSAFPGSINSKSFDVDAEFNLYFENTTDRDTYYNVNKQAACFQLLGNGIGNGLREQLIVNFYQTAITSFDLETGLDSFYAEKVMLNAEYDNANSKSIDMALTNTKTLYI